MEKDMENSLTDLSKNQQKILDTILENRQMISTLGELFSDLTKVLQKVSKKLSKIENMLEENNDTVTNLVDDLDKLSDKGLGIII